MIFLARRTPIDGKMTLYFIGACFISMAIFKILLPKRKLFWLSKNREDLFASGLVWFTLIMISIMYFALPS